MGLSLGPRAKTSPVEVDKQHGRSLARYFAEGFFFSALHRTHSALTGIQGLPEMIVGPLWLLQWSQTT